MTSLLATLIFLLADGTPARQAEVRCLGVGVFAAGSDTHAYMPEGSALILDGRGAVIIHAEKPITVMCSAAWEGQQWSGFLSLKHKAVMRLYLR